MKLSAVQTTASSSNVSVTIDPNALAKAISPDNLSVYSNAYNGSYYTATASSTSYARDSRDISVYIVINIEDVFQHPALFLEHEDALAYIRRNESVKKENLLPGIHPSDLATPYSYFLVRDENGKTRRSKYIMFSEITS